MENSYIKSIMPVQQHGKWVVRVRFQSGEQFFGADANYTLHQAEVFADSIRRDIAHHGAQILDTLK